MEIFSVELATYVEQVLDALLFLLFFSFCMLMFLSEILDIQCQKFNIVQCYLEGVISGALLYIRDEFQLVNNSTFLQVTYFLLFFHVEVLVDQSSLS